MPMRNMMQQNALNVMVDPRNAVEPLPEKRDQDPRHRSTIIIPDFSYRNAPWRNRVKWPQKQVTGNAVYRDLLRLVWVYFVPRAQMTNFQPTKFTGLHGPYRWLVTRQDDQHDLATLLESCPQAVVGKYVAVTSLD